MDQIQQIKKSWHFVASVHGSNSASTKIMTMQTITQHQFLPTDLPLYIYRTFPFRSSNTSYFTPLVCWPNRVYYDFLTIQAGPHVCPFQSCQWKLGHICLKSGQDTVLTILHTNDIFWSFALSLQTMKI